MTAISGDAPTVANGTARDVEERLRRDVDGEVHFDDYTRHLFSRDASMYAIKPIGVVFPRHADDVQAVVAAAGEFGVPVVPRGAGTSLAGQTVGPRPRAGHVPPHEPDRGDRHRQHGPRSSRPASCRISSTGPPRRSG